MSAQNRTYIMKKLFLILLIGIFSITLMSCGSDSTDEQTSDEKNIGSSDSNSTNTNGETSGSVAGPTDCEHDGSCSDNFGDNSNDNTSTTITCNDLPLSQRCFLCYTPAMHDECLQYTTW